MFHGIRKTINSGTGAEEIEDDGEPFEEKMARLTGELAGQFKRSRELEVEIRKNLEELAFKV